MLQKDLRCCGSGNTGNYHGYDCEILKIQTNIIVHVLFCYILSLVAGGKNGRLAKNLLPDGLIW